MRWFVRQRLPVKLNKVLQCEGKKPFRAARVPEQAAMARRKLSSAAGAGAESGGAMGAAREPSPENLFDAHAAEGLEVSGLDSTGIDTQGYMREDRWPGSADLWIAGAQAPVESPIAAASDGEASAMRDKLLAENGDEDEAENFIQDDDSAGDEVAV